ncbi:MAG: hypothetical protein K0R61_1002 [Microvirga sp.]|jgi:hypothetical protein|nr:hypothetical protein [Microvirga sp.]
MRGCRRHQPPDPACPICAGRFARRRARAILATNPRQLHAVNFRTALYPGEFRCWRVSVRNLIDHQRRSSNWWRGVSMHVWLGQDGRVRGVVALDAIMAEEFEEAFRRWPPTMRRIAPEELADEVYAAVRPGVIAEANGGGYQKVRFTVRPRAVQPAVKRPVHRAALTPVEPMPVLM